MSRESVEARARARGWQPKPPGAEDAICRHSVDTPTGSRYLVHILINTGVAADAAAMLPCSDVHDMARSIGRTNYLAAADRRLLLDEYPPAPVSPRYEQRSRTVALILMGGMFLAVLIMCSAIWRFYQ